jgi:hypothetical protein
MNIADALTNPWIVGTGTAILAGIVILLIQQRTELRQKNRSYNNLIELEFGGGQVSIGKFDLKIYNRTEETIHHPKVTCYINNPIKRHFEFWKPNWIDYQDGMVKSWESIRPGRQTAQIDVIHLERFLIDRSPKLDTPLYEIQTKLYRLLYPSPVRIRIIFTFLSSAGEKKRQLYLLTPNPDIKLPESLYGDNYSISWHFRRLR